MTTTTQRQAAYDASRPLAEALAPASFVVRPSIVRVPSRSVAGVFYDVHIALDGTPVCCCPASFNHLNCWHLDEARKVIMTTTEVAIRPVTLSPTTALIPSTQEMDVVKEAAKMVFSGKVALPEELNSEAKVAAIMLYGLELGLRPMTAIRHLYIVKGKVSPSAEVMAGMLMKADPQARLIVEELTNERCTMRIIRPGRQIDQRYSVDWEEIKKAGLATGNNLSYPRDRLRYHCTKRILRIYAPDIINGFGEPSLESMALTVEDPAPAIDEAALYNDGDEPVDAEYRDVVDRETGEIPLKAETPIAPTADQLQNVSRLINEIKESWGGASKEFLAMRDELLARYGKEKLAQYSLLTYDEAGALLLYLRRKNGEPVDMPLDDEVPAGVGAEG